MRVVYSLGSNLGDRVAALRTAVSGLAVGDAQLVAVSPVYETEPWGVVGHPDYLNVVAVYEVPDDVAGWLSKTPPVAAVTVRWRLVRSTSTSSPWGISGWSPTTWICRILGLISADSF
jgi:2-amino-4-hydroxy-6-hydroxymethyldihydropteridine diphosphokinase